LSLNRCHLSAALAVGVLAVARWPLEAQPAANIAGSVFDAQTGRPITGVTITIEGKTESAYKTDTQGRFTIAVPPGTYALRFTADNYNSVVVRDVTVASESVDASTVLSSKNAITTVEVIEKVGPLDTSAEAALSERKLSPVVSDAVSREELKADTSSDAAGALQKVTGVSVVGEGYVYVRGLGERYSSTELNGAVVPTTEPEKRVVPLDLFPTGLIERISIAKTYSPGMSAEFSGGLVQMHTVEFPAKAGLSVSFKSGFNTATTFNKFLTYPGGTGDFFGFGSGSRGIPASIPRDARVFPGAFTQEQLQSFGRAFSDNWEPTPVNSARPAVDWSAAGGGTFGRFGIVGALSFSNTPEFRSEAERYLRMGDNAPIVFTDYPDYREYTELARLGAVFNTSVRFTPSHTLSFHNTYTHEGEKSAREFAGYDGGVGNSLKADRLRYVERSILSNGVGGEHSFAHLANSLIHWQFTYSRSTRYEPDLREVFWNLLNNGRYIFAGTSTSGLRFFSDLNDEIFEPQVDYSIPFFKGRFTGVFKAGFNTIARRRNFGARRFLFQSQNVSTLDLFLPSDQLFAAANIRPDGFQLLEYTRQTDQYDASMNIYAGYFMVDLTLGPRLRLITGLRLEAADQVVTTKDNLSASAAPVQANLQNTDPAPAVNVVYAVSARQNLRLSYSRTLSRPDFRELSPFDFANTLGGFITAGNANLKRALINNYDARWEYFPGGNQLMAVSYFAKTFTDPIERIIVPSNDLRQTFVNAKGARNLGIELEYRRSLATWWPRLQHFGISTNFTFVDSNVDLNPQDAAILTSQSRPLLGQSRYIANGIVEWQNPRLRSTARFSANYASRRISDVGTFQLPDIYQEGNVFLDFSYQYTFGEKQKWSARFEAENLGNNDYLWTQGSFVQREYRLGRTFQIGLTYTFF
jgi:outer membrane receptor protein involved in Fe transport